MTTALTTMEGETVSNWGGFAGAMHEQPPQR